MEAGLSVKRRMTFVESSELDWDHYRDGIFKKFERGMLLITLISDFGE